MLSIRKIVCPTDFTRLSSAALKVAGELAGHFGAELLVLHIVPPPPPELGAAAYPIEDYARDSLTVAQEQIGAVMEACVANSVNTRALLGYGTAADGIGRAVRGENADLVVMATHGWTGWRYLAYGSVAETAVQTTPCPVLIVHDGAHSGENATLLPFRKILCPTDYSEVSHAALKTAGEWALHFEAQLCLLHVVPPISHEVGTEAYISHHGYEQERLASTPAKLRGLIVEYTPSGVKAYPRARLGKAAENIVQAAGEEGADLIVLCTHGRTGWRHLVIGSVAEKVLRLASCPVLVIHALPSADRAQVV